jgi:hypothetical protein
MDKSIVPIDITDVVEKARASFVIWGIGALMSYASTVSGLGWISWPVIGPVAKYILNAILTFLSKQAVLEAFILNTAIRKSVQASDFLRAVDYKNSLPENASDEVYDKAERDEIEAFVAFASISN